MSDLKNKIIYVNEQVKHISTLLKSVASKVDGKDNVVLTRFNSKMEETNSILDLCLNLINIREKSFEIINSVKSQTFGRENESINSEISYMNLKVPVSEARILSTTSYLSSAWSLYDVLQKACLELIIYKYFDINKDIVKGKDKGNEKGKDINNLFKNSLLSDKSPYKYFSFYYEFICFYKTNYHFSYFLRNCFIHNGGFIEKNAPIFSSLILRDSFIISSDISSKINGVINDHFVKPDDLIIQLKEANDNIDLFFVSLLQFSLKSFLIEISCFISDDVKKMLETDDSLKTY